MKKFLSFILFGFMVTSCSGSKTEEEVKINSELDSVGLIGEIAKGNDIGFNRIDKNQFSIETKGMETNYKLTNGKVTEIVVDSTNISSCNNNFRVRKAFNIDNQKNAIKSTFAYDDGGSLVYAKTNGQVFESKTSVLDNERITALSIDDKIALNIAKKENLVQKTFANGDSLNIEKVSDLKRKINIDNLKAISLDLDLSGNIIKEFDGVSEKKFAYDDYGNVKTAEANNFTYEFNSSEVETVIDVKIGDEISRETFSIDEDEKKYKFDEDNYSSESDDYEKKIQINNLSLEYIYNFKENEYEQTHVDYLKLNGEELYSCDYDNLGNLTGEASKDGNVNYFYDSFGQLIGCESDNYNSFYVYDLRGNILEESENDSCNYFSYGEEDLLTQYNGKNLTYDESFNLLTFGDVKFSYERGNVLTKYENSEYSISYDYDSNNIRKSAVINGINHDYYYIENKLISEDDGINRVKYLYDSDDQAIGFRFNNQNFFYVRDAKQCIKYIVDGDGQILVDYEYNPWGEIVKINDYSALNISSINHILYKGYYYDFETGLYYLTSRYYSPKLHRFITRDSLERLTLAGSSDLNLNLFAYANNNPIMKVDPMGYEALVIGGIVVTELVAVLVGIVLIVSISALTYYLIKGIIDSGVPQKIADALTQVKPKITKALEEFGSAAKKAVVTWLAVWWKWWDNTYRGQFEVHHIIARTAAQHSAPRQWLKGYHGDVNCEYNLVRLKKIMHKHLHTKIYYNYVKLALYPFSENKSIQFFGVLGTLKAGLLAFSNSLPS